MSLLIAFVVVAVVAFAGGALFFRRNKDKGEKAIEVAKDVAGKAKDAAGKAIEKVKK